MPNRFRRSPLRTAATVCVVAIVAGSVLASGAVGGGRRSPAVPQIDGEMPATAMDRSLGQGNTSPTLASDPTEPKFVVLANRLDARDFSCALQLSGDGGRGWLSAQPVPRLPLGAEKCYAPEIAFDRDGALHYLFVGLAGHGNQPMGAFLTSSSDRGRTFSPPRQVLGPLNFSVRMAIDRDQGARGRMHLVWLHTTSAPAGGFGPTPNPIMAAHSDDGGLTFSPPEQVSDPGRDRAVAPTLALAPDHAVHIAYYDLGQDARDYQGLEGPVWDGRWSLVLTSSFDGGQRFERGVVVDSDIAPPERVMLIFTMTPPALVADADRVCLAWADARHGDSDVLLRCSANRTHGWEAVRRLNDDPVGNGISQYMPRLGMAPDGRLDVIFYDRRVVPGNFANDVFYTFSTDGGRTFAPNVRLTQDSSDSRIGAQYANPSAKGQWEFGSRIALLSRAGEALAGWTDTRNSLPQTTGQDIFTVAIHVGRTSPGAGLVVGLLLLGAGVLGLVARTVAVRRRQPVDMP